MKSYTDIEQSKKLAEFLPIESADMRWYYKYNEGDKPQLDICNGSRYYIPCWSLAALLNLLPSIITRKEKRMFLTFEKADGAYNLYYKSPDRLDELWETKEDIIDAVVEMILTLHEEKLL